MNLVEAVDRVLVSPYGPSLAAKARARRWQAFSDTFPGIAEMDVLDLGGETRVWRTAPVRPRRVTVLNTSIRWLKEPDDWLTTVHQDACDPHIDGRYDLVYSNSVIEHVGGVSRRVAFAANVQRLAPRHWIQTPYRYFPVEPHFVFPAFQFMPLRMRRSIAQRWPWPLNPRRGERDVDYTKHVLSIELLSVEEMRWLFPDSLLRKERLGPFTKSLIAVRK